MSSVGPSGSNSKPTNKNGLLRSSSPARVARPKTSSSSLSSQLSAHLNKPVTPRAATAMSASGDSPPSSTERRPHVGIQQSGKAVASAADVEDLASSELWKTNAAKRAEKQWAIQSEKSLQSDAKFKKYSLTVEKSLATFESVSEWADFIAFLGRLLKTFQLSPSFNAIPRKLVVAKRLSQCLNPALPSGVHQRALDVYEHILTVIGREGLRRDLLIWSPGLMPFFQYASTSVKPIVLSIFERHFLALGQDLRPVTKAFLLACLPGLEEETNEFFDRVIRLLDRTRDSVGQPFFLQSLCLVLISSPDARLPALNYLARRLPKLNGDEGFEGASAIIGSDLGLLVRGFAAALEDEASLLVRRAALDILVTHLRLDSTTWRNSIVQQDKVRLIKAALAVVLRRDLSLNRRLYAWILGPSEEIPAQQKYFEENAQKLSRMALLSDLVRSPLVQVMEQDREREGADRQRPYKIFVSLLDKWSIGQPLTNVLVLDTYYSLQRQLEGIDDKGTASDASLKAAATDISTTAKMLFEVVDPFATYRQFYYAIIDELQGTQKVSYSAISLLRFVFKSFRVHDEESRQIHLPVLLSTMLELLDQCKDKIVKAKAIQLALTLLALIPKRIFLRTQGQPSIDVSFASHAKTFYESDSFNADEAAQRYIGFQHPSTQAKLLDLSSHMPLNESNDDDEISTLLLQFFAHLLRILDSTVDVATEKEQATIQWNATEWFQSMLSRMQTARHFKEVEALTSTIVDSAKCRALDKVVYLGRTEAAPAILTKLLVFLQVQWTPYHTRTVELLWSVADLARGRYVENLLCKGLTSSLSKERRRTLDVFGALWQYTSEERLASAAMTDPLLHVLDGLRSLDWRERQASERWIKANLRGYTLFLDPLLHIITEAGIRRQAHTVKYKERSFPFHRYTKAFDHEQVLYSLGVILQLARFGGQGFVKALRSVQIKRSHFKSIIAAHEAELESSYLQVLLTALLLFIRSDPSSSNPYLEAYTTMHVLSADLLQAITMRGPLQGNWLTEVEGALLERLYISIQERHLSVQSSLLQALQSVIRAKTSEGTMRDHAPHPLLVGVVRDGISHRNNRSVLSSWTDFILTIVPHYRSALTSLLLPLNEIVCQLLIGSVGYHKSTFYSRAHEGQCEMAEAELILLMNINERLLLQCLDSADGLMDSSSAPSVASSEKAADSSSLMGALSNVFQADTTSTSTAANFTSPNGILQTLHHSIRALHVIWAAFNGSLGIDSAGEAKQRSLETLNPRVKARCRRSLERVYRNNSGEVVESLIDCWNAAGGVKKVQLQGAGIAIGPLTAGIDHGGMEATLEILSTLAPSAQIVVTFLCDVISTRTTPTASSGEKTANKKTSTPIVSESILMFFWEDYLDRLDSAASMQVWPVVIMLVRDILHNSSAHKAQMYPILRCLTVTGEKIVNATGANEDKKIKRELFDNYLKLCDFNILIAGRSFDQTNWIGRRALTINDEDGGEESGRATPTMGGDEKMAASLGDMALGGGGSSMIDSINEYLGNRALPALRMFGVDQDKVLTICTNVVYYIITPIIRQRRKTLEVPLPILKLLTEVTRLPGTVRAWKNVVADVFQDSRFFQMRGEVGLQWLPIVLALLNSDKERFVELIAKVTSTPSSNIFTNKEAETLTRGNNLRRIAGVIYAADKDHWLTHLAPLQEKLVELLRNGTTDPIGSDVYLCLRVLLLRFSSRHLSAFWPVIITELMRLLEGCLDEMPADDSDALQLVYSACKFLDFLLTLQTNDFQIHQWLFITDTVDVVYPPSDWTPDSILDRMASTLLERKNAKSAAASRPKSSHAKGSAKESEQGQGVVAVDAGDDADEFDAAAASLAGSRKRRPQLMGMGSTISTIEALQPFFATVSLYAFEQTYDCGDETDLQAVERSVEADLFPVED